jgi:hydrogenase expression/formation protein HypE
VSPKSFRIGAVVFDFDGTLTEPGALGFASIREAIGCPAGEPILEFLAALPDSADRDRRMRVLESLEREAAAASLPSRGAEDAVLAVRERGLPVAILSRNGRGSIERALANFTRVTLDDFDLVLTRESHTRPKPAPDGLLLAARRLHVEPARMLVVGDYLYDLQAGRAAGAVTVLVTNGGGSDNGWDYDLAIDTLSELPDLIDRGVLLPAGGSLPTGPTSPPCPQSAGS